MKKILSILLTLVLMLTTFSITAFAVDAPMSNNFKKALNSNGELELKWATPTTLEEAHAIQQYVMKKIGKEYSLNFYLDAQTLYDSGFASCDLTLNGSETHNVNVKFNYDKKAVEKFKKLNLNNKLSSINSSSINDLGLLNWWITNPTEWLLSDTTSIFGYDENIKSILGYENIKITAINGGGNEEFCGSDYLCSVLFEQDGVVYYSKSMVALTFHYIYVPSSTGDSYEELIAAAQKRINDYFGKGVAEVTKNHRFNDKEIADFFDNYQNTPAYSSGLNWEFLKKAVYNKLFSLKINGSYQTDYHEFVIIKDDEKCKIPHHKTVDKDTNISIETDSYVPLDSLISVKEIVGDEFDKIIGKLNVKNAEMFDLKLFSDRKNDYVTRLPNGYFEVRIPISENFKGKNLVVYYVKDNGKPDKHKVSIKDGFAVFNTDHFSIYTLAELPTAESQTGAPSEHTTSSNTESVSSVDTPISSEQETISDDKEIAKTDDKKPNNEKKHSNIWVWIVVVAGVLVITGVVITIFIIKKKKTE